MNKRGPKQSVFVGDSVQTPFGICTVSKYNGALDIDVVFQDGTKVNTRACEFKSGSIKNPNYPTVFGVGYIGVGSHKSCDSQCRITPCYNSWSAMLNRCYGKNKQASYENVEVCNAWHNFQTFAEWYGLNSVGGWELDKDLIGNGKLYSPENCCFLPKELNILFRKKRKSSSEYPRGVSKLPSSSFQAASSDEGIKTYLGTYPTQQKAWEAVKSFVETKIKSIAERYKLQLFPSVYTALLSYEIKPYDDGE